MDININYRKEYLHRIAQAIFKDGQVERGRLDVIDEPDDEYSDFYFVITTDSDSFTFLGKEVDSITLANSIINPNRN
ncbi:hypothetical protein [Secundilactobacillus oryzae]|uniref:hypothetical protein n=2 Tax=Secundilactobacillus oryzae TaxID=1202668 RepID=UPI000555F9BA|nr:hypothetical protein [Secundilactobacillus oryzae]